MHAIWGMHTCKVYNMFCRWVVISIVPPVPDGFHLSSLTHDSDLPHNVNFQWLQWLPRKLSTCVAPGSGVEGFLWYCASPYNIFLEFISIFKYFYFKKSIYRNDYGVGRRWPSSKVRQGSQGWWTHTPAGICLDFHAIFWKHSWTYPPHATIRRVLSIVSMLQNLWSLRPGGLWPPDLAGLLYLQEAK